MCELIGENEIYNGMNNKMTAAAAQAVTKEVEFTQTYERRMVEYMRSVPHIPPTQFELKLRHQDIKADVMKHYKNAVNTNTSAKQLVSKLDNLIEKVYTNLCKKNAKEYRTCQAGFIIGWKCNVNKPHTDIKPADDRF